MEDIWSQFSGWKAAGKPFALARVVKTWGSAPRKAGAAMIVGEDLQVAGSVSAGCVEGAVIEESRQILKSGTPKRLTFGVDDKTAWSVGLSCGGELTVLVEGHPTISERSGGRSAWASLVSAVQQKEPAILLTHLEPAEEPHLLVYTNGNTVGNWGALGDRAVDAALDAYSQRLNQVVEVEGRPVFVQVFPRRDQLLIIGAGHISIPLVHFAHALDFETVVIDPRKVFANQDRFETPPHQLLSAWPQEVLDAEDLTGDTYAVLLTHDPKIDDQALHIMLRSTLPYIGALGSRKTHASRCERLRRSGFSEEDIARVKGPAGLDIKADSPAEIALSIMAEVVAAKRDRQQ